MAQLKDLLVAGPSRFIGDMFGTNLQITKINAPTAAGGAAYGVGSAGQALCSNGTSVYWGYPTAGSQANLVTTANSVAYFTNTTGTFAAKPSANGALYATSANGALQWGTLPTAQGGTGHASNLTAARLIYSKSATEMADSSIVVTGTGTALTITGSSGGAGEYVAKRGSSSMFFGFGSGNVNHGVYSYVKNDWIVYSDGSGNVTLNGNAATATKLANGRTLRVNLASTSASTAFDGSANVHDIGVDGVLPLANGGTGKTNAKDAANVLLNGLETGGSTPVDADYYISQYVGGGTTTTTYHRRPMSALWAYISGKITANRQASGTAGTLAYYSSADKISSHPNIQTIGGHLFLAGSNASSSTANTTQIVFGTSASQHVAVSANSGGKLIVNPTTSSTTGQIVLSTSGVSTFNGGGILAYGVITAQANIAAGPNSQLLTLTNNRPAANIAANQWFWGSDFLVPNAVDNTNMCHVFGKANSNKNSGVINFHYAGNASDNNYTGLGVYGFEDSLKVFANKDVAIAKALKIPTQTSGFIDGIQFLNGTTKKGSFGCDHNGILALYSASKVVIRPVLDAATDGVEVTTTTMYPTKNQYMTLGTSSLYWDGAYIHGNGSIHWNNLVKINGKNIITTDTNRGLPRVLGKNDININGTGSKLWGMSPESIIVETTEDNGTTWTENTALTVTQKRNLTNGQFLNGANSSVGGLAADAGSGNTSPMTVGMGQRITFDFQVEHRFGWIECLLIYFYCRSQTCSYLIERWSKNNNTWKTIIDTTSVTGNNYRVIYPDVTFYMNGNTSSSASSYPAYCNKLRITFMVTALSSSAQRYGAHIGFIAGWGSGIPSHSRSATYPSGRLFDITMAQWGLPMYLDGENGRNIG